MSRWILTSDSLAAAVAESDGALLYMHILYLRLHAWGSVSSDKPQDGLSDAFLSIECSSLSLPKQVALCRGICETDFPRRAHLCLSLLPVCRT